MSLTCSSQYAVGTLHLLKEGGADPLRHKTSRSYGNQGREQAVFPVGPVTTSHGGTYRCYDAPSNEPFLWSRPSDPLHLQVTGEAPRPLYFLDRPLTSALCPMSPGGDGGRDTGLLGQDTGQKPREGAGRALSAAQEQGGRAAACLHAPSAGLSRAPSLSAQPSLLVLAGDNLTLQCRSEAGFGSFALTKDEGLSPPLHLEGQQSPDFPLGRVSRAHGGQYRCYSGHNSYAWSAPSAPLDILIAGEGPLSWPRS